eukprot:15134907-Alexandrium_andersonii.AAC.1
MLVWFPGTSVFRRPSASGEESLSEAPLVANLRSPRCRVLWPGTHAEVERLVQPAADRRKPPAFGLAD